MQWNVECGATRLKDKEMASLLPHWVQFFTPISHVPHVQGMFGGSPAPFWQTVLDSLSASQQSLYYWDPQNSCSCTRNSTLP